MRGADRRSPIADGGATAPRPRSAIGDRRSARWRLPLAVLGPGLIAAAAGNDAGGVATYSSVGARYGYDLLWLLVLIAVALTVVQEMCARMGAVTGKGLSALIREQFGIRWTAFAMLTLLVANSATVISEFAGIAAALELLEVTKYVSVPTMALIVAYVITQGTYERVEKLFIGLTFVFFAYVISAFLAQPDWSAVMRGLVVPTVRTDHAYVLMIVALIGTTITPYMQIILQSSVVEKGVEIRNYRTQRLDVIVGCAFSMSIAAFIIICTGATFASRHQEIDSAAQAARALAPVAGAHASTIFAIGLFGASMLAAGILPLSTAFSICEAFGWEAGVSYSFEEAREFYTLFIGLIVIGAMVTLIPGLPLIRLLLLVQVVNGLLLPVLLFFTMRLVNDEELMGPHRNTAIGNVIAWGTTICVSLLALVLVVTAVF
jgi:Mn2+/Fe2+ NRAMP family transporter